MRLPTVFILRSALGGLPKDFRGWHALIFRRALSRLSRDESFIVRGLDLFRER